ncbi:MAG: hypothetical protein ACFFEF_18915 [Candidatus Thorarchaeota archaeon]
MNRYDLLVIMGLIVFFMTPILIVQYYFIEPPNLPVGDYISIWHIPSSWVIPQIISILLIIAWTPLIMIQGFNVAYVTRKKYSLMTAWVILLLTAAIEYMIITVLVFPFIEFAGDAHSIVDLNIFPPLILNSALAFYTCSHHGQTRRL